MNRRNPFIDYHTLEVVEGMKKYLKEFNKLLLEEKEKEARTSLIRTGVLKKERQKLTYWFFTESWGMRNRD